MIRIREIKALNRPAEVQPDEVLVVWLNNVEVIRASFDRVQRVTHVATFAFGNAVCHAVGDENLEADLKKMAAVKWTDRDLIQGLFDNLRNRPEGPQ